MCVFYVRKSARKPELGQQNNCNCCTGWVAAMRCNDDDDDNMTIGD